MTSAIAAHHGEHHFSSRRLRPFPQSRAGCPRSQPPPLAQPSRQPWPTPRESCPPRTRPCVVPGTPPWPGCRGKARETMLFGATRRRRRWRRWRRRWWRWRKRRVRLAQDADEVRGPPGGPGRAQGHWSQWRMAGGSLRPAGSGRCRVIPAPRRRLRTPQGCANNLTNLV